MTYRARFRVAALIAAAKWLHAAPGSDRERKYHEQLVAAKALWHARKHDTAPDPYEEVQSWQRLGDQRG